MAGWHLPDTTLHLCLCLDFPPGSILPCHRIGQRSFIYQPMRTAHIHSIQETKTLTHVKPDEVVCFYNSSSPMEVWKTETRESPKVCRQESRGLERWLSPCTALVEDQSSVPRTHIGGSQPPVILAPEDPTSLASTNTSTLMHTPTH